MITDKVGGSSAKPEVSKQSKEKRLKHKVSGYIPMQAAINRRVPPSIENPAHVKLQYRSRKAGWLDMSTHRWVLLEGESFQFKQDSP